ncbi:endonuclease Q family protein [Opitutus sp. GAS368]|uniref:endonuclease Q family protein n=1 Tax=Opitutus sp. GAS368 TaxID=1882749 RepID=UPI00087CAEC1|nr:endonuclease Q family protein [Opitutus sp. GAS368]SDR72814.1 DNA helicase-2 / ATP-dependent DNA helicase PcrA [Opitutus sp. GAS368]
MRFAADLHLHSRHAGGVSPAMTLENIALWAQRKGVDLLGTGDCLQPQWLAEIEAHTMEAGSGLLALKPEMEKAVHARLPEALRRSLRFVLSTEVNCAPPGTEEMQGIHQLVYFPSPAVAREFAARVAKKGDLQEGRPTLALSCRDLVRGARDFDRVHVAAPHVMNPWFSVLGVVGGGTSAAEVYGDELPNLWAVETGLTSNPAMCRRVPGLDRHGLYSCSDAHSLENIGRECTLLDIEPGYDALMAALRAGSTEHIQGTLKYPIELTRYFLNWCSDCQEPFGAWPNCPECGRKLTMGSRDRLEKLSAVRPAPAFPDRAPPFEALRPLRHIVATVENRSPEGAAACRGAGEIVDRLGPERYVLAEAGAAELLSATTPEIARDVLNQRTGTVSRRAGPGPVQFGQAGLGI